MQVKMMTTSAGPDGNRNIGEIVRVSDKEAAELIAGGYAEPLNSVTKTEADLPAPEEATEVADEAAPETADLPAPEEKAVMPEVKPKSRKK